MPVVDAGVRRCVLAASSLALQTTLMAQLLPGVEADSRAWPQVLLLAATNRPEVLDRALLRPGRISRRVAVPLPDEAGRRAILAVHLASTPMEAGGYKDSAIGYLAALTAGFSGAELQNVVNEGALLAARRDASEVCGSRGGADDPFAMTES